MAVTTEARTAMVSVTVGDQELTFETGKLAKQADGAVLVGAGRIGLVDGELVVNPTLPTIEADESTLDLIVVGTTEALTMVEAGAEEVPEETILEAFELAHGEIVKICEAQEDLRRQAGKE